MPLAPVCVAYSSAVPPSYPTNLKYFLPPLISLQAYIYTYLQLTYYQGKHGYLQYTTLCFDIVYSV